MEESVVKLEKAARILAASPSAVSRDEWREAEQVFLTFETTPVSRQACRKILESGCGEYVQFHVASALKKAIAREWSTVSVQEAVELRAFLTDLIVQNTQLSIFAQSRFCEVLAVVIKCCILSDEYQSVIDVFCQSTADLLHSPNRDQRNVAVSILIALLNEFSAHRPSDGFTLDIYRRSKRKFEETTLLWAFILLIKAMTPFGSIASFDELSVENKEQISSLLNVCSHIMSWSFSKPLSSQQTFVSFADAPTNLMPPVEWKDALLNSEVLGRFFKLGFMCLRHRSSDCTERAMQCLLHLASLSGPILENNDVSFEYVQFFVSNFLEIVRDDVSGSDALGIANVFSKLTTTFSVTHFHRFPPTLLQNLIQSLTHLTREFNRASIIKETGVDGDSLYSESLNQLLDCFAWFLLNAEKFPRGIFFKPALDIFTTYLDCRLRTSEQLETTVDIHELEEDDCDAFSAELRNVALIGRSVVAECLPLLCDALKERTSKFDELLRFAQSRGDRSLIAESTLTSLHEETHWLLLISAFFLADDDGDDATTTIPCELLDYSIAQVDNASTSTSVDDTARLVRRVSAECPTFTGKEDRVVELIALVLRLAVVETALVQLDCRCVVSPQVCRSIVFFLRRWCVDYLLFDETAYSRLSMPLVVAFGNGSDLGADVVKMILNKVVFNFMSWSGELKLVDDSGKLLLALVQSRPRSLIGLSCESLWDLAHFALFDGSSSFTLTLPSQTRRCVAKALALIGSAVEMGNDRLSYWRKLLEPFQARCAAVLSVSLAQEDSNVKLQIISVLECIHGLSTGARKTSHDFIFSFLVSMFASAVSLLDAGEEIVSTVLEMFVGVTDSLLPFLNQNDSLKLYEVCLELIKKYSTCCTGKRQDNLSDDLCLLLTLLTNLISKDCLDFSDSGTAAQSSSNPVSVADVVLFGLSIVLPLVTMDLLRIEELHAKYFKLISFICDIYPDKVNGLPDGQFEALAQSLEIGVDNFDVDVTKLCFEGLSSLCDSHFKNRHRTCSAEETLKRFFPVLFNRLILHSFEVDLMQPASEALFSLICCYPEEYTRLLHEFVHSKQDPLERERLVSLFSSLIPSTITLTPTQPMKRQFRKQFDIFLVNLLQ